MLIRTLLVSCVANILLFSPIAVRGQESLADIIERCEKSVVRIETKTAVGDSLGSGFVVDANGTMITNCHVLAGATAAKVQFADGTTGDIVGTLLVDQARDIIVAKISTADRPVIALSSDLPRKGESVLALGAPHGLAFTATRGIISAIRSEAEMTKDLGDPSMKGTWVQVDAALSPGNSGGPLINEMGQVVAMSTLASRGSAQNLNFGISGNDIRQSIDQSKSRSVVPLTDGVAKIRTKESSSGGRGQGRGGEGNIVDRKTVPAEVLKQYATECNESFTYLVRDLRKESDRLSVRVKEMKNGQSFIPPNMTGDGAAGRRSRCARLQPA